MGHGDNAAQTVELIETRLLPDSHCQGLAPADLLKTLHGMLESEYAATGRFVTALALLVDGTQGTVVASNAAVPEPLLGEPGGSWQTWSISGVAPLGLPIPDMDFADTLRSLAPGEHLLAFTDGVTEAGVMCGKDQFQHGHLHTCLNGLPAGTSVDQVVEALRQAVQGHVGANWPEDDTTVLGIQRT
jgi:serine phosphatase RsbU (regulator of sigma subunit)